MYMIAAVLAVALSLRSPTDYTYTTPFCGANQIVGVGMGAGGDYTMLRAEDVAFLREAYTERTDVPFAFISDLTNAIDRLIPVRPRSVDHSAVFEDADWGGCFSLSYTTNAMPYSDHALYAGSFVRNGFSFDNNVQFTEVDALPGSAQEEFRLISADAVSHGKAFTTNEIPAAWYDKPYVMTTNHICALYAGLPLFDVAALESGTSSKAYRTTTYDMRVKNVNVARYETSSIEDEDTGMTYYYYSGYAEFATSDTNTEQTTSGPWSTGFTESRRVIKKNEFSCQRTSGDGPWPIVVLGNFESERYSQALKSVSNCYVWIESPVKTNAQDDIQILQAVLAVRLTHTVNGFRKWTNPSVSSSITESTNIVRRAVMCLQLSADLDKSVGLNWNGTKWFYKMSVPMDYIHGRATSLFGDVDAHWPDEAKVEDDEIATSGTSGGTAIGDTYVSISTSFGMRVYMVYRRTYRARTL